MLLWLKHKCSDLAKSTDALFHGSPNLTIHFASRKHLDTKYYPDIGGKVGKCLVQGNCTEGGRECHLF